MEHVEDKDDVWKTLADKGIDLVNRTLLAPLPSAPPIVESFQMQLRKGTDYLQEVSDTKLMLRHGEGDSNSLPPPYTNSAAVGENGGLSSEKKSTEAPPRRRKRDSKPFINFKIAIIVISKLVGNRGAVN